MNMIKTTMMALTKNTLLNTISAQITYTRGALIALFAGLFILAACGGGAAPTDVAPGGGTTDACATNIFDPACGVERQAERTDAINTCIDAIKAGDACEVPTAVLNCLNEPFTTEGCSDTLASDRVSVTIESVQATRTTDCRAGTNGDASCDTAIVNVCGEVTSTNDGVLFTETLCGTAYDASRTTLINNCREAGDASDEACTSVVITTDATANQKALDCVLDAFAEGCDTNTDVANVVEKTDATIKPIAETRQEIEADCRGLADFATNSRCTSAIESTCDDNPFTLTTGVSPTNFCTGANDGRAALITRCSDTDTDCDKVVSAGVTVETCVATPYATGCSDDAFNGLKQDRYTHCTGATPTDDCSLVETTIICLADTAKASNRANPFSPLCRASTADYTTAQSDFCAARAGDSLPECATGFLTTCDDNPLVQTCIDSGLYTEAGQALTLLCTTDSTLFDNSCNGFTNTVTSTGIDTTRDNICNTEATSFHAGCLGRTGGDAEQAREAFVITCRGDKDATGCDTPITEGSSVTVGDCATNPYQAICTDDVNFADEKGVRNTLCTDPTMFFDDLCGIFAGIDTTREMHCTTPATSFDANCDDGNYAGLDATREGFASTCRTAPTTPGCEKPADGGSGTLTIADCSNGVTGDPYQTLCLGLSGFDKEVAARAEDCAVVAVLESSRCDNAKMRNDCVVNPFGKDNRGADCDPTVYETARNNRDSYCAGSGIATDNELCTARKDFICDGTDAMSTPTADICGADNRAGEQELCRTNDQTDGECSKEAVANTATACQGNPFNPSFGAYRLNCKDLAYYPNRIAACSGAINALPDGGTIDDCAVTGVADVICANSGQNANPFADICAESEVIDFITGFKQDTVQQEFCGATPKAGDREGDCEGIYKGICVGDKLFMNGVGAGGFACSTYGEIANLREGICTTAETSFNPNCKFDGTHGTAEDINNARESLALTCRGNPTDPGCDTVADATTGVTVAQCSGYTGIGEDGDPYQAGCLGNDVFDKEREARALACSMGDEASDGALCGNAVAFDACIGDPFGKVTGSEPDRADCASGDYTVARTNRESFCGGPLAGTNNPLCTNASKGICDGVDLTDTPFALTCPADNSAAQSTWCGLDKNSAAPECLNPHAGTCSVRPFDTAAVRYDSNPTDGIKTENCLTHGSGETYRSHRQALCAVGAAAATAEKCDTATIAPIVCAMSSEANYNPFATFCLESVEDGKNKDEILMARQTVLTQCTNEANAADFVCKNAAKDIRGLNTACGVVGATSLESRCDFTQYEGIQKMYCAGADSVTVFDTNCEDGKHGGVDAARKTECRKTGSATFNDAEACTEIVAGLCTEDDTSVLQSRTAGSGYLCMDAEGSATYNNAREVACGVTGTGIAPDTLTAVCKPTLARICTGKEFTTAGMAGYNCAANTAFDGVREAACGVSPTVDESDCMATRLRICTGDGTGLVETAGNGYDCSASTIDTVETERRRFCADPQGGNTAGCPTVLAGLCTGASSLLNGVATGGGVTYDCKDDGDDLVLYQRQEHCAQGTNDNLVTGCPDVITTLCAGKLVQTSVPTGTGTFYPCATSEVPAVKMARENHCRLAANHSGGLCDGTIASLCGINPFEERDSDGFGSLCEDSEGTTYAADRELECRNNGTEGDGQTGGKCATLKVEICDGNDVGDSPYADVCGTGTANLDGQTEFCRLSDHSTTVEKCGATIVTVCHVDNGNPFDALCPTDDNTDRQTRANACRLGSKSGNDCKDVATCNADPFGEGCNAEVYADAQTAFCTIADNVFNAGCTDIIYTETTANRRTECLKTGTSSLDTGDLICPGFVTTACANPFTKQTANTDIDLCTGSNGAGDTYEEIRTTACSGLISALPIGVTASACNTEELSGAICGNGVAAGGEGSVAGSNPFADICSEATGNIYFTGLTDSQQNACRTNNNADGGNCTITIEGFCGTPTTPTDSNNLFDTLCNTNYETARNNACLNQEVTAGANNGNNDDCNDRQFVKDTCMRDPFTKDGCDTVVGRAGFVKTYCTTGATSFHVECLEGAGNVDVYGDVDATRDNYCRTTTIADDANCVGDRKTEICGAEETSNPFAALCSEDAGNRDTRQTFCMLPTKTGVGDCSTNRVVLCTANPFGTNLGVGQDINCTTGEGDYSATRKALADECLKDDPEPAGGATCTQAIKDCIANPFRTDTFEVGVVCDADAFAGAFVPYCEKTKNAWQNNCNDYESMGGVMAARQTVCNTEATSFRAGCEGSAYAGIARDTAQEALALTCVTTPNVVGCGDFVNGVSGTTVAECSKNPFSTDKSCFTNTIFEKQRVARIELCEVEATSFNDLCDILDAAGTDTSRLDPITTARTAFCTENAEDAVGDCGIYKADICDGAETTDNPYASICDADNLANQKTFCGLSGEFNKRDCPATIVSVCHVETGNPFDTLCPTNDNTDRKTRAEACLPPNPTKTGTDCKDVVACNTAPFGAGCDATIYAGALEAFCTEGDDIFDGRCVDKTHGEVTAAQLLACKGAITDLPTSAIASSCNHPDLSGVICGDADTLGEKPFAEICSDVNRNSNHDVYRAAQQHACREDNNADGDNCADTIGFFCGTPLNANVDNLFNSLCNIDDTYNNDRTAYCTIGDKIFETICDDDEYGATTVKREEVCRGGVLPPNTDCTKTIENFCEAGDSATANIFDSLCEAGYALARKKECSIPNSPLLNHCAGTIADLCTANPFTQTTGTEVDLCVDESESTTYADARAGDCRLLITDASTKGANESNCMDTIRNVCGELDNADTNAIFGDALCTQGAAYTPARIKFCSADNPKQGALTACRASADKVVDTICNGGEANADWNPYADICAEDSATAGISGFVLATAQSSFKVFCGGSSSDTNPSCPAVIAEVCSSASDTDLFSTLCDTGYTNARVAACQAVDVASRDGSCAQLLIDNCTVGNIISPACAPAVAATTLPASFWAAAARNADNSGTLNVLDEIGLDDAYTSYVQGTATGLQLGAVAKGDGSIRDDNAVYDTVSGVWTGASVIYDAGNVSLADLDHLTEAESQDASVLEDGAAFAFVDFFDYDTGTGFSANPDGSVDVTARYYAGLFSGTDLGGPVVGSSGTAIWNAAFAGYLSAAGGEVNNLTTSLLINFDLKEINTRDTDAPVVMSTSAGSISIAGKFTDAGVIYGTSSWTATTKSGSEETATEKTASGSVTGLIGKDGAVGAFVSSGENDGIFEYAGGFVAAPVNCTDATSGTPFHRLCNASDNDVIMARETVCGNDANSFDPNCATLSTDEQRTAFAEVCRMAPETKSCDRVLVAKTEDSLAITVNSCTNTDGSQPHQTGCGDAGFAAQRGLRIAHCLMAGNGGTAECTHGEVTAITGPCGKNPFSEVCDTYAMEYDTARNTFRENCGDFKADTIGTNDCTDELILDVLCVADGKPVSFLCDGYDTNGANITTIRETFCRDGSTGADVRCAKTRKTFCDANLKTDKIFDMLCDTVAKAYDLARGEQCARTTEGDLRNRNPLACGSEGTTEVAGSGFLRAFCKTDAGRKYPERCPIKAAEVNEFVDTIDWEIGALDSDGTTDLTILESVGANDAKDTNYVKAGTDGLKIADVVKNHSGLVAVTVEDCVDDSSHPRCDRVMFSEQISTCDGDVTRAVPECSVVVSAAAGATEIISDTAELPVTSNAAGSGFAIARINSGAFTQGSRIKYYAGILSDTDLGNPVTSNTLKGKWDTNFSIIFKGQLKQFSAKLTVMLDEKTIKSKNAGILIGFFGNRLVIDGKFTDKGVIYGTSKITLGVATESGGKVALGTGTLTGLIGQKGAVGVFVSDGTTGGAVNQYAGGFVADNPDVAPDCTADGLLFLNTEICQEDSHRQLRARLCQNRGTEQLPAGITGEEHCTTAEVKADICVTERNPFDTVICANAEYDAVRGEWCLANPDQRQGACGDENTGYVSAYCLTDAGRRNTGINRARCTVNFCTYTNALHSVCNGDDEGATYAAQRHDLCAPESVKSNPNPICVPVIDRLCNAEPFNTAAGEGTTKIDCVTANSGKYATAGQARITLCADGTQSGDSRCMQASVTAITSVCTDNPFATTCTPYATQYATQRDGRIKLCADGTKSTDPLCEYAEVLTITNACTTDPFAPVCAPFATHYTEQRTTRLNDCLTPSGTRKTTECTNADAPICSYYSPFDAICVDTNNGEARKRAVLACAPDNTRDEKNYVLPTLCDTIVSTAAIAAVTVKDCIKDPLNKKCNGTAAIRISDCRADAERQVAACNVRLASGVTIRDCIADPENDRCSGEVAIGISACRADPDREVPECDVVISAEVPSVVSTKKVSDCVADPWNTADCPQHIFDNIVKAAVCETEETSFTAGCLVPANGFVPSVERTRLTPSQNARRNLIQRCADTDDMNDEGCNTVIAGGKTLANCVDNPFDANCRGDVIALALTQSSAAVAKRTALVTRCADSKNLDRTNCDTMVAGAGSLTITQCTATPFVAGCSGDGLAAAFSPYRAGSCTTAATSFNAGCTEDSYSFTETVDVIDPSTDMPMIDPVTMEPVTTEVTTIKYRDTARAELALGCADDPMGAGCKTIIVSGNLTVDGCNTTPFAPGCESPAFTNARLEACKNDDSPNAACSVATALERTNYVTDLDTNPASLYVGDTYVDDTSALKEGVQVGGLTLNDVGYAQTDDGVYTDQSASGFALAYIPEVREGGISSGSLISESRYYAGVLAGTDVGAPPYDNTATGAWTGKLSLVNKGRLDEVDFTLDVDFTAQTIAASDSRMGRNSITTLTEKVDVKYAHTALGQFYIDGKFTTGGVIYGTTKLVADGGFRTTTQPKLKVVSVPGSESSSGSLTGIIGQNGAVGAFVSSGAGRFVNTLGEYAGGFVAAPVLNCDGSDSENKNPVNPLDIRCDSSNTVIATAQEDACSDAEGLGNPACIPVFARVCIMGENAVSLEANHESDNARIQCRNAPQFQTKREEICAGDALINGLPTERCANTVTTACMNDVFSEICNGITAHEQTRYTTCSAIPNQIFDTVIDIKQKSANAISCNYLITNLCDFDGLFDSRFCYIGDKYTADRLAHCADHNIAVADKEDACTGTTIDGLAVNVVGDYCSGRAEANDDYGICNSFAVESGKTAQEWRKGNADLDNLLNVIGAGGAYRNDSGHIAGGVNRLVLGDSAVETAGQVTLRLTDTNDGIAIATGAFGGTQNRVLQSYAGLLATSNLGPSLGRPADADRPSDGVDTFWNAQIALGWQGSGAREASDVVVLWNNNFTLTVTYGAAQTDISAENIALNVHSGTGAPTGVATFTIDGHIANAEHLIDGTVALKFSSRSSNPPEAKIHGVLVGQGRGSILATFATGQRSGQDAYAGGFVAENLDVSTPCATNGRGNPFHPDNACSAEAKLAEATRCYANGASSRPTDGDCIGIDRCFRSGGGELWAIASTDTDLPMGVMTNTGGIACQSAPFDGVRAIACSNNPQLLECTKIASDAGLIRTRVGGMFDICIARPFGTNCEAVLGADAYAIARLERATDCMIQNNIVTHASGYCKEFIAAVGTSCSNNPFDSACVGTFMTQVNAGFAATAQEWRLSYCTRDNNEASDLCTGALTYCAVDVPNSDCGTLVADYCLGGMGRTIIGRGGACPAKLAKTCDVDPFNPLMRCVQEYADARQNHCDGTTPVAELSLDKCLNTGLDADICGDMDSLGSNPFADVCNSPTSNANFGVLENAQTFYCRDSNTNLDEISDCESVVTNTCGTGGFDYTTNPNKAFDPLCRQETYDYARLDVCLGDPTAFTCPTFLPTACPADGIGLIGCAPNENSTPISVWADNVSGILAEGEARRIGGTVNVARFAQAGADSLDLSDFDGTPAQYKITLTGDDKSGVAFANSLRTHGGALQLFAGLLRGTNVGGPLLNNTADGEWAGKVSLAIGRGGASPEGNFTLRVAFTGNGGTLTTQDSTTDDTFAEDIDIPTVPDAGGQNRFTSLRMRIDGAFTAEGVIYGTTNLYGSNTNEKTYEGLRDAGAISTATLTGLIGKTGAVGAFHTTRGAGNLAVYIGGFVATPGTEYVVGNDCTIGGAENDGGVFLFSSDCDYATDSRALWCGGLTAFDNARLAECRQEAIQKLVCKGTGAYANPFTSLVCNSDSTGKSTRPFTAEEITANQLTFANQCDAGTATGDCSKDTFVADCLLNPYSAGCVDNAAFANIRTQLRPAFCNGLGAAAGDESRCAGALEFCARDVTRNPYCGTVVSEVCLATPNRLLNDNVGLCFGSIQAKCNDNPFHARCTDSIDKNSMVPLEAEAFTRYDTARQTRCDGFSEEYLTTADRSVLDACNAYAPAICGYYVAAGDLLGPRPRTDNCGFGGDREPQGEVIEIGSNPLAAICTNKFANRDRRVELTKDEGGMCAHAPNTYNQTRQGEKTHDLVLAQYRLVNCPETATAVARLTEGCDVIDVAGGDGYEAWETAVGGGLITAGDAANATEKTNFIAGYGGGLFLGVGTAGNVENADTFTIPGTDSGFAYATTGTAGDIKLFTGLLSGTTDLGGFYTSAVTVTWRSTLSFLTNQSGSIAAITKDGFALTLNYDGTNGTIKGIETVGDGSMVFQVDGTFTGNLLSGTVTFGETEGNQLNGQFISGKQTTGILTGIIGADGTVGVFKSNTEGSYGDFAGGFVAAPPGPATETVWARSFRGRGGNAALALHSHGLDITNTGVIADGARAYIRLNANNQPMLLKSTGAVINTIAFFNNNGLVTPDNGDSGVTFGSFARKNGGGVSLVGLWPTTNMGLPLTAQPKTAIWRGKISAIYAGKYTGEKDVRFTIGYDGPGGTVTTTDEVFIVVENFIHQYIHIDAQFDRFGAVFGTTRIERINEQGVTQTDDGAVGTVSGLIGEKGLIGGFVSTKDAPGLIYLGGFYALNPDAERAVSPGAATNAGLWESSLLPGGLNSDAAEGFVVDNFGAGADAGQARFARFGTGDYIAADLTDNSQALLQPFGGKDNGVGFGVVDNRYYSGLLAGANVGLSLTANQAITPSSPSATWTGEIALYGSGNGLGASNNAPSSIKQDFSFTVTFDGTGSGDTAGTIAVGTYDFGYSFEDVKPFKLTITNVKFDAAGVITGTTSLSAPGNDLAQAVSGVLTGLIGTRGAIGSFISTGAIGTFSGGTYAGAYAGGFVVQNPDYEIIKEIPVLESADLGGDVKYDAWMTASGAVASNYILNTDPRAGTFLIQGTATGITTLQRGATLILDESDGDGTFTASKINKVSFGNGFGTSTFAGLWSGANLGGALKSPPTSAIWTGEIGAVRGIANLGKRVFRLSITFEGPGGTVRSSGADGVTDTVNGDYQSVNNDYGYRFAGTFTAAGVMTGTVAGSGFGGAAGTFNGIIGIKGAIGVFKSADGTASNRQYVGGFTASNPDYNTPGVTAAYSRWRSSFDGAGLNGRAKKPGDTTTTVANPLQPRGVNVNQFANGSTHFVQGTDVGLNLVGSSIVTENFNPTLLTLEGSAKVGFALWQGDVNVPSVTADSGANTQGYVGLLNGTKVGESPLSFVGATYTGKIQAYVGDKLSDETNITLTIDYNDNFIDGSATLTGDNLDITEFTFDGGFNILGVMFGDVYTGVNRADGIQGSFNGLIGTKAAVGVFKNTAGNSQGSFIGGFVARPRVDFNDWVSATDPLADGAARTEKGISRPAFFIRGTADSIMGIEANTRILTLTSDINSGIAFGHRPRTEFEHDHQITYYAGLLSGTDVGRHIDNDDLNGVWVGKIQAYLDDGVLVNTAVDFNLNVAFGATHSNSNSVGTLTANALNLQFNGYFDRSGVMSGTVNYAHTSNPSTGTFNGIIGTLGAVGVFKDDNNDNQGYAFSGGFIANPPTK